MRDLGGNRPVDLSDKTIPRFVHAAHMIHNAPEPVSIEYGFEILKTLERGSTRWSYVIDVNNKRVYFHTSIERGRKHFDISSFDLSGDTPSKVLNINSDLEGDVAKHFADYSPQLNRQFVEMLFEASDIPDEITMVIESHGNSLQNVVKTFSDYPESMVCVSSRSGK